MHVDESNRQASEDLEGALSTFAESYIRRVPDGMTDEVDDEKIYAELRSVFDFVATRRPGPPAIRVFDPNLAEHGYEREGTVVDVVVDDTPFLVDSVRAAIEAAGQEVTFDVHCVIGTERNDQGELVDVISARAARMHESVQHYVLDRQLDDAEEEALHDRISSVLGDVRRAVIDFEPMQKAVDRMIELAGRGASRYSEKEVGEAVELLAWLKDFNFVFLGYREYEISEVDGEPALSVVPESGLGILRGTEASRFSEPVPISRLPEDLQERYAEGFLLVVAKTNRVSTVHRPARMDYVGVRVMNPDGTVAGEARMLGLFTSRALMDESATIPILRGKLQTVLDEEDLFEGSHDYRAVVQMFNSFPKADLWSMPVHALRTAFRGLLAIERKEHVRLFVSPDLLSRSVSVVVVMPRDRFNAELRRRLQELFVERYGGTAIDYQLTLGEEGDARLHFTVWLEGPVPDVSFDELQQAVVEMSRTWEDRLTQRLDADVDDADVLVERWSRRLPDYYKSSTEIAIAAGDIVQLDALERSDQTVQVGIQNEEGERGLSRVAVYGRDGILELSVILPVLESLGLRVVEEVPTRVDGDEDEIFIHDIGVLGPDGTQVDLERCRNRVIAAIEAGLRHETEPDSLDRLIVTSPLNHRQLALLKAYRTYRRRVSPGFTVRYVNDVLASHPKIATRLVELFRSSF